MGRLNNLKKNPKLLFFITEDWAFCSHRFALAKFALKKGFDVVVITRVREHGSIIEQAGMKVIPLEIKRDGLNPLIEMKIILKLAKYYYVEKPDLVHHVALKPVIYGSIAAKLVGVKNVINTLTGLGFIFSSSSIKAKVLKPVVKKILKKIFAMNDRSQLILQNIDDCHLLQRCCGLNLSNVHLIRGSGIDVHTYIRMPQPRGLPIVVLAARMLWEKGVGEFVEAARELVKRHILVKMVLVGNLDRGNPGAISRKQLEKWNQEGIIEWWGNQDDMRDVFAKSHIVCLPSYREGLPKVLLEAAASGRPIITTNTAGCREVVLDGITGKLIPIKDAKALADTIVELATNEDLREEYGLRAREYALKQFSENQVNQKNMKIYKSLLGR